MRAARSAAYQVGDIEAEMVRLLRHHLQRSANRRQSAMLLGGMVLLLATCGWIVDGEEGAVAALSLGAALSQSSPQMLSPEVMHRQFGVRPLRPQEWPGLHGLLGAICQRAALPCRPALYCLPDPHGMNAYALGAPEHSAIILTEGLLRRMSMDEIAGILAHEVGHIRNNDSWALGLAAALQRTTAAIARLAPGGLLAAAPMIGHMLYTALSRLREFDADSVALELIEAPAGLVMALCKLEQHHNASQPSGLPLRFLHSHPATWERVASLQWLAGM